MENTPDSLHTPTIIWAGKHLDATLSIVACSYCSSHAPIGDPIDVQFTMISADVQYVGRLAIIPTPDGLNKLLTAITSGYHELIMTQKKEGLDHGAHLN